MLGRVVGTLLGALVARVPGVIIGFLLGFWYDRIMQRRRQEKRPPGSLFFYALFASMGHLAKAKGRVTTEDIRRTEQVMTQLGLNQSGQHKAQDAFRAGKATNFPLHAVLVQFRNRYANRRDVLKFFLEQLIVLALDDGQVSEAQYHVLVLIARELGISRLVLDQWLLIAATRSQFRQWQQHGQRHAHSRPPRDELSHAYRVLGVTPQASDVEVKKAWRKLMRSHHPDKLAAQGLPEEMKEEAKKRTQDIQAAYDIIRAARKGRR